MNTIGKDFIFEIVTDDYRQYAFNIRSIFGLFGYFASSYLGYEIYYHYDKNFLLSSFYVGRLFYLGAIIFFIQFFCFFKPGEIEDKEELKLYTTRSRFTSGRKLSLQRVFFKYFSDV